MCVELLWFDGRLLKLRESWKLMAICCKSYTNKQTKKINENVACSTQDGFVIFEEFRAVAAPIDRSVCAVPSIAVPCWQASSIGTRSCETLRFCIFQPMHDDVLIRRERERERERKSNGIHDERRRPRPTPSRS
jgi:hypothetical protein